jgi:tetraacyldisaccharide 4'-kinase
VNIQAFWSRKGILNILLLPLSWLFGAVVALRRWLYGRGLLTSSHPGVPVIVAGNLNAGGSGKTPFVIWLVQWLRSQGYCPGVISRGYGRRDKSVRCVAADSRAGDVGDEPLLIHLKTGVPVAVGAERLDAARLLLARNPGVDVIVADDGLQHYKLRRDLELVLADAQQLFGNGWMLPAGPLREPVSRLNRADALILNGSNGNAEMAGVAIPVFGVRHEPAGFRNVANGMHADSLPMEQGREVEAVTGIARPENFFRLLAKMRIPHHPRPFPDHHPFSASDIDPHALVVMTEKDAVKCKPFSGQNWWALELRLSPSAGLTDWLAAGLARR